MQSHVLERIVCTGKIYSKGTLPLPSINIAEIIVCTQDLINK